VPTSASALILILPDSTADDREWELVTYDENVLSLRGEPEFRPVEPGGEQGALVWTFDIAGEGATDLQAEYRDASGEIVQLFFVSVSVQDLAATPF
jgi:hypothetical protein